MSALGGPDEEVGVIINFREEVAGAPQVLTYVEGVQHQLLERQIEGLTITHRYQSVLAVAGRIRDPRRQWRMMPLRNSSCTHTVRLLSGSRLSQEGSFVSWLMVVVIATESLGECV